MLTLLLGGGCSGSTLIAKDNFGGILAVLSALVSYTARLYSGPLTQGKGAIVSRCKPKGQDSYIESLQIHIYYANNTPYAATTI